MKINTFINAAHILAITGSFYVNSMAYASSSNEQTNEDIAIQKLSVQSATDIYSHCLIGAVSQERASGETIISLSKLKKHCQNERYIFTKRTSVSNSDNFDTLYLQIINNH